MLSNGIGRAAHLAAASWRTGVMFTMAAGLLGASGCLFLSPDDPQAGLRIEMIARTDRVEGDALARAVIEPAVVLASDELTARARMVRTSPGPQSVETVTVVPLDVGPLLDGERTVSGLVEFNAGPVGSTYSLVAEILYLGLDRVGSPDALNPAGNWQGEIAFEASSLNVQVQAMSLVPTATTNVFDGSLRLTHPSLNAQQTPTVELAGVVFDPKTGGLSMSYLAPTLVQWDESTRELEVIEVSFDGVFAPVVAFSGAANFDFAPVSQVVTLDLEAESPIEIGRRIEGTLRVAVHENDGSGGPGAVILSESGAVTIVRARILGR